MEIRSQPGVGSDGTRDVSNKMMKVQMAGLGFRVKSGWAAVVLLTGSPRSPQLSDVRRVELSDPRLPETRQPYHAAMGKLETDSAKINRRERVVRCIAEQSVATLLAGYRRKGYRIKRAGLVVGSKIDPTTVANPHIRAHAFEGQLFRAVMEEGLQNNRIRTDVLLERDAYAHAATQLKQSSDDVRRMIGNLDRMIPTAAGPWRSEQKLAAVAALFVLC